MLQVVGSWECHLVCEILWLMQVRDAGTTRVSQTSQKEKGARLFCLSRFFLQISQKDTPQLIHSRARNISGIFELGISLCDTVCLWL